MRQGVWLSLMFLLTSFAALAAPQSSTGLYCCDEINYVKDGKKVHGYIAYVDLLRVKVTIPTGPSFVCEGQYPDVLVTVEDAAVMADAELAINANFFARNAWHLDDCTRTIGVAVSDGEVLTAAGEMINEKQLPDTMLVTVDGKAVDVRFVLQPDATYEVPPGVDFAVSGVMIVQKGQNVSGRAAGAGIEADGTVPRTAIGVMRDGRTAVVMMIEGRMPGISDGIDLRDLADQMLLRGVENGLTLDGGGSSTLIYRPGNANAWSRPIWSRTSEHREGLMQYRPVPVTLAFQTETVPCVDANEWYGTTFPPLSTTLSSAQTQTLSGRFDVRDSVVAISATSRITMKPGSLVSIAGRERGANFTMQITPVTPCMLAAGGGAKEKGQ
ncbi:MAG TPA: phosphodiester glycosidase family protein [Thermoanaerobaculia bacterium]|nr:phosphodiester glycosidase family protein [Thermoanaerobaculia bacterium]